MYADKTRIQHEDGEEVIVTVRGDADDEVLASFELSSWGTSPIMRALSPREPGGELIDEAMQAVGPAAIVVLGEGDDLRRLVVTRITQN